MLWRLVCQASTLTPSTQRPLVTVHGMDLDRGTSVENEDLENLKLEYYTYILDFLISGLEK